MPYSSFTRIVVFSCVVLIHIHTYVCSVLANASEVDFQRDVFPVFVQHCLQCHGPETAESGLRLDIRPVGKESSSQLFIPGDPKSSPLYQRIISVDLDLRMPPEPHSALDSASIDRVRRWIASGAVWPESEEELTTRDRRLDHWAWQPLATVAIPNLQPESANTIDHPIDAFIASQLQSHSLRPSAIASRRELIRRLSIDLLGLPPTYEEVQRFIADPSPDAYEALVDRYLASPEYAERFAQTWLDISHYADTHGFERDQKREHAWRYRDYVIRSLGDDKPYDQFLREQIAGDAIWPERSEAVVATGFLAAGPWDFVGQVETPSPQIKRQARADDLDDMLAQIMTATCGVTIHCARCHNHKLDPISQQEYYQMWALLSGSKRGDRDSDPAAARTVEQQRSALQSEKQQVLTEIQGLERPGIDLADVIGEGDGRGSGHFGRGLNVATGQPQQDPLGFLSDAIPNRFVAVDHPFIDGVVIPNAKTVISSTGILAKLPSTSGQAWDAIRHGPVQAQKATTIGAVDFASSGHRLLSLHANAAITFDVLALRKSLGDELLEFQGEIGYGGRPEGLDTSAQVAILLDGLPVFELDAIGPESGRIAFAIPIPQKIRFLSLVATEGNDGIGHDQIFFGDPRVAPAVAALGREELARLEGLRSRLASLEKDISGLPSPERVYAIRSETPEPVHVLTRGDTEQATERVAPGFLACIPSTLDRELQPSTTDLERRAALAEWITSLSNPLPSRVMVNRLWQHHFGSGLVNTASDFGLGGEPPSHPELLDWLAMEFRRSGYSIKAMQRLICTSHAYRQSSRNTDREAIAIDTQNRFLWRQSPRRIEAEVLRDCVLSVAGSLNRSKYGPGFQDFEYQEEYAPIYRYRTADRPELWKRSIYRFVVRTTPHPFLTPLDCPDPANLTSKRTVTTTAVQSLTLWNNSFVLSQARQMAERIARDTSREAQVRKAFHQALARDPTEDELRMSETYLASASEEPVESLAALCRVLLNSNEFVFMD